MAISAATGPHPANVAGFFKNGGSDLGPVAMDLPDGSSVRFRGRIDRVEVSEDGRAATVVDYKTGRSDDYRHIGQDPINDGRLLQLPPPDRAEGA